MPSWNELVAEFDRQPAEFLRAKRQEALQSIAKLRGERNVIFYASAFLQKMEIPAAFVQITHEDINGFMSTLHQMECSKGLTLLLHTPGGVTNAAETIVDYLHSKFEDIEVIVPVYAMSAGTMLSLSANRIIMGRQSQLGPIDPQMPIGGSYVSAQSVVDQFAKASREIAENPALANVWYPILQSIGPALLQEAQNALDYSENVVQSWLEKRMFRHKDAPTPVAKTIAHFFRDAAEHLSHGSRIDRDEVRAQGLHIEDLEENQEFQEAVLTAYHLITIAFEKSAATKIIESDQNRRWIKNYIPQRIR